MADKEEIKTLEELEEKEEYCVSTKKNSGRCAKKIK